MRSVLVLLFLVCTGVVSLAEEMVIVDTSDRRLKVKLMAFDDNVLEVLMLKNRKPYKIPISKLNEETQKRVKEWVENGGHLSRRFEVQFSSGKRDDKVGYDEHKQLIKPKITIENVLGNQRTVPVKLVALVLGRPVLDRKKIYVFAKEEREIPSLQPLKSFRVSMDEIEVKYDDENYHQYGKKYVGYAVFLLKGDEVVYSKFNPASIKTRYGFALLKASPEETLKPVF